MLDKDEINNEIEEEPASTPIAGLLAQEYEPVTCASNDTRNINAGIEYPILNFFRGSVTSDRMRHENAAQHGGLAHWRHNTSKQQDRDDRIIHSGMGQPANYDREAQAAAVRHGSYAQSPGMGLDAENFQSFITGSHHKVISTEAASPMVNKSSPKQDVVAPQVERQAAPVVTMTDIPLTARAGAEIYNYRRKKSSTFTNLIARARSILQE
jgi:hypothetical protein